MLLSQLTRPTFFMVQPKLTWLVVLSSNYCLFYFDVTIFHYVFHWLIFTILVPFESLSHYPIIDSSHWLREEIQLVVDKFWEEKGMGLMASTLFSRTILLIFCALPTLVVVLIVMRLIVMTS